MRYLIDTQIMIWLEMSPEKLSQKVADILSSPGIFHLSKVSVWELVIKASIGKIKLEKPTGIFVNDFLKDYSIDLLDINLDDMLGTENLPGIHKDPFDRLIIAQCISRNIPLISADQLLEQYPIQRIW
jgi:PIN domain nuclease of toxin-antitoxin system